MHSYKSRAGFNPVIQASDDPLMLEREAGVSIINVIRNIVCAECASAERINQHP